MRRPTKRSSPDHEPDATDPLGAAYLWWAALQDRSELNDVLKALTYHPPAWGGNYEWADQSLSGTGLMQFVERCPRRRHHRLREIHAQC